jgi:outer membrane protein assembly factor BamA
MIATRALGGDYDFVKGEVEAKQYLTLFTVPNWGKHILSIGADAGLAGPFGPTDSVPIFDRFFAGGPGDAASLRGFRFRGIGPVQGAAHVQVGGQALLLGTLEYDFPIMQDTIRGVVFADAGKVARTVDTFGDEDFRAAVGTGLRLRFPFFGGIPIALDWGVPVAKQATDLTQVFSFTIGTGFRF